ncbi:DUF2752 domain-containing protein [Leptolyngbya sp. AN10]|uniref:DUF2752 domain-containing protein n=1 Tax=Leptolyngbya sp. AN10 TaxID=3423365 RepID=UPI003D31C8A2
MSIAVIVNLLKRLPNIYREYRYVNYALLALSVVFLLYPLGVSIPGEVESYLPFELPTIPSFVATNYPDRPCSSCGLTRSIVSLYHFDLNAALRFNKAGILVLTLAIAQFFLRMPLLFWKSSELCWFDLIQLVACGVAIRAFLDASLSFAF